MDPPPPAAPTVVLVTGEPKVLLRRAGGGGIDPGVSPIILLAPAMAAFLGNAVETLRVGAFLLPNFSSTSLFISAAVVVPAWGNGEGANPVVPLAALILLLMLLSKDGRLDDSVDGRFIEGEVMY